MNRGLFAHSVLGNLLTNAIKFSPVGGTITIKHKVVAGEHIIDIQDNGTGINEQTKKFFSIGKIPQSETGTLGEKGTGFGLLIAKQVIALHKGTLTIISPAEGGTIMRITLPG